MNVQVRPFDCQDDHFVQSPEHRATMAMQSIRGGIAELSGLLRQPNARELFAEHLSDVIGAELALALIVSKVGARK